MAAITDVNRNVAVNQEQTFTIDVRLKTDTMKRMGAYIKLELFSYKNGSKTIQGKDFYQSTRATVTVPGDVYAVKTYLGGLEGKTYRSPFTHMSLDLHDDLDGVDADYKEFHTTGTQIIKA